MDAVNDRKTEEKSSSRRVRANVFGLLAAVLVAVLLASAVAPAGAKNGVTRETADVMSQGGGDEVLKADGAKLTRRKRLIKVNWTVPTPGPGSYDYPTADMIPPTAPPHPAIAPSYPEVFTLWAFVFNNPEMCEGPCDGGDIGDTPAQGGVFQVDATIADDGTITMAGKIRTRDNPARGARLQEPSTAEVHLAMAPHGRAACGDDLLRQLAGPVGGPPFWFVAQRRRGIRPVIVG